MKKVILTGATGFIGRHTINTLIERGFEVHAVTSKNIPFLNSNCSWHIANLLEPNDIKNLVQTVQATYLLHLAWYAVPGKYWTSEENFLWVQASIELIRQFYKQGGQRIVIAGTCAEYDWNYGYCSEGVTPTKPNSTYGICKNALQEMLKSYSALNNLSSAWGRIFFLHGPYEQPNRLIPSVINSLMREEPALCSHGNQIRDYLYVQDVADAFVALLDSEVTGAVNIASGQPIAIRDIVYKIGEQIGKPDLIRLGAIPTIVKEPSLLVADVSRLLNEVGWLSRYNLNIGLEKSINYWHKIMSV